MTPKETENIAKATRMRNAELASALRTIASIQDDDSLAKWVLGVAAERLSKKECSSHMPFTAYMTSQHRQRSNMEGKP
jgi:hypothetical protein